MDAERPIPNWYKHYQPIYTVTADCVLEWPDINNPNEYPIICPVHGILSYWNLQLEGYGCTCDPPKPLKPEPPAPKRLIHEAASEETIKEVLKKFWRCDEIPAFLQHLNSGDAADSLENRRMLFQGDALRMTPRGPVIVNSHSLRARTASTARKPYPRPDKLPLGHVYAYLEDLGMFKEWCAVFRSQIRRAMPDDIAIKSVYREVTVYRRQNASGILVNVFPDNKCFVTYIDYTQFLGRPEVHYGDQILEFLHCILQTQDTELTRSPQQQDVFRLRVRPCPFLKWLTIRVGNCPLVDESSHLKSKRTATKSYRDLGFCIHRGRITAVALRSPAQEAGLQPDHHVVQVEGHFVVRHTDAQIVSLMRQCITANPSRSVTIMVIPQRLHEQLKTVNNTHHIASNRGFHLNSWLNADAFGLSKSILHW